MACNDHKSCDNDFYKKPCGCGCNHKHKPEEPCGCDAAAFSAPAQCYKMPSCGCGYSSECARVLSACANADSSSDEQAVDCTGIPIRCERRVKYRTCCNQNGRCYRFPCQCRNPYWPEFCHPRWLCCQALYCNGSCRCANNGPEEPCESCGCGCAQ